MLTTAQTQAEIPSWIPQVVEDLDSSWVKEINPPSGIAAFPRVPNRDVRIWADDIATSYIARGRQGGHDFVKRFLPLWLATEGTHFELPNEPECNSNTGLANIREFTIGAIEEAVSAGIKLVIFNFSEGSPHDNNTGSDLPIVWKWQQVRPAAVLAAQAGFPMGRHCYYRPGVEGPTGRYHALGRLKRDLDVLSVPGLLSLVNEFGVDGGIASGPGGQGWRTLSSEGIYRSEIIEAEKFGRTISGLQSIMYFLWGAKSPWESFDIYESFARSLVGPLRGLDATPPVPPAFSPIFGELDLIRPIDVALGADSVSQWFGENISYYATLGFPGGHPGIDYRCPIGTRVKATHDGTLIWGDEGAKGYGLYAMVQGQYITTLYGHLSSILRPWKQQVKQGDEIALSGNSGNSTGPHLHFEVMIAGGSNPACKNRIDPKPFRTK